MFLRCTYRDVNRTLDILGTCFDIQLKACAYLRCLLTLPLLLIRSSMQ